MKRKIGHYWVYGNKCFPEVKRWNIGFWDGNYFWVDGDDFNETNFMEIDERIILPRNNSHNIKT